VCGPSRGGLNHHADLPPSKQLDRSPVEHVGSVGRVVFLERTCRTVDARMCFLRRRSFRHTDQFTRIHSLQSISAKAFTTRQVSQRKVESSTFGGTRLVAQLLLALFPALLQLL